MDLLLLCGIPGSGKSTWAKEFASQHKCLIVSRDAIRFAMLDDEDDYFSKEDEVLRMFYYKIKTFLEQEDKYDYVIVDATNSNAHARLQFLKNISFKNIIPVYFNVNLKTCKERNALRTGRAYVPEKVVERMYKYRNKPTMEEYPYKDIWEVYK